jgi:hypothetical protein
MRCSACNVILTTSESVRRFKDSGEFVDLCNKCLSTISDDVQTVEGIASEEEEYTDDNYPE